MAVSQFFTQSFAFLLNSFPQAPHPNVTTTAPVGAALRHACVTPPTMHPLHSHPLMVLKKNGGCECSGCTAGRVTQACLNAAPTGAVAETFGCGACGNLFTLLDMKCA